MLEDKIKEERSWLGKIARNVAVYTVAAAVSITAIGCDSEPREKCYSGATVSCDYPKYESCTKPVGAPESQCECYCAGIGEPKDKP